MFLTFELNFNTKHRHLSMLFDSTDSSCIQMYIATVCRVFVRCLESLRALGVSSLCCYDLSHQKLI